MWGMEQEMKKFLMETSSVLFIVGAFVGVAVFGAVGSGGGVTEAADSGISNTVDDLGWG